MFRLYESLIIEQAVDLNVDTPDYLYITFIIYFLI